METSVIKMATLSIIDLAGSERASATLNKGERLHEGANINRSLLALGNCINALCSERSSAHIPFRWIDSAVVMIANISPALVHADETHNTLKYANRAKDIKTKVSQNTVEIATHISQYPAIIKELREEIARLRLQSSEQATATAAETSAELEDSLRQASSRVRRLFEKIKAKKLVVLEGQSTVLLNEAKMKLIRSLLVNLNELTRLEEKKSLNDVVLKLNVALDALHEANAVLLHNTAEAEQAIDRYQQKLKAVSHANPGSMEFAAKLDITILHHQTGLDSFLSERTDGLRQDTMQSMVALQSSYFKAMMLFTQDLVRSQPSSVAAAFTSLLTMAVDLMHPNSDEVDKAQLVVDYDTATEDGQSEISALSDHGDEASGTELVEETFEAALAVLQAPRPDRTEPTETHDGAASNLATPRKQAPAGSDGENEPTPMAVKRTKKTPALFPSAKKTPRKRAGRMSLIPRLTSNSLLSSSVSSSRTASFKMSLRSKLRNAGSVPNPE
ncbi:kinesin-like protein Klp5 [Kappamyces sp. JEL0680]|nr:kinesin-like protein Klp5 [Kappamyces sp. JEL0680]